MRSVLLCGCLVAAVGIAGCGTQTRTVTDSVTVTTTDTVTVTKVASPPPAAAVSPPDLTNGNGIYLAFAGPDADAIAGAFQQGAAKNGTYWSTFSPSLQVDYSAPACRLRYGRNVVAVVKANSAIETGIEGQLCAGFLADGWHQ